LKKVDDQRLYSQKELIFWHPTLQPLGNFSHVSAYRSFPTNTWEINFQTILNKTLPQARMELEFDMLGVAGKLVRYVVYLQKKGTKWFKYFFSHSVPKYLTSNFWSQGILGVNP
jgi:hypothetical protein